MSTRRVADSPVEPQLLEAAADWFIEFRVGDGGAQAREAFYVWLRRSPEHIRAYLQIARLYADSKALAGRFQLEIDVMVTNALTDSNVMQANWSATSGPTPSPTRSELFRRSVIRRPAFVLAAIGIVVVGILGGWLAFVRGETYETSIGAQHSLVLADGSKVSLDASSHIRVRLSSSERSVELLSGQALFDVAKDTTRPFTVRSHSVLVRAVGTRFDVIQRAHGAVVTVIEGRVEATPNSARVLTQPVLLSAGEKIQVPDDPITPEPVHADIVSATAWTSNRLVFDATPLAEVVEDFNRYNPRRLVLQCEQLKMLRVTGIFSSTQPDSLIRFLRTQPGVIVRASESQITITRE